MFCVYELYSLRSLSSRLYLPRRLLKISPTAPDKGQSLDVVIWIVVVVIWIVVDSVGRTSVIVCSSIEAHQWSLLDVEYVY